MITAVGGEQENPCGSNIASLFFVTQQAFAPCAGAGGVTLSPRQGPAVTNAPAATNAVALGGNGSDAASQQMITAVGGEQENPCGSNIASLFFVTQQAFARCTGGGYDGKCVVQGAGVAGAASQHMNNGVGCGQQTRCGSDIASLFFVTQQAFARCAGAGGVTLSPRQSPAVTNAVALGGNGSDAASQQMITAVGGEQENPCGSNIASLFFVTQQAFARCTGGG